MQVLRSEEKAGRAGLSKCQKKKKRGLYIKEIYLLVLEPNGLLVCLIHNMLEQYPFFGIYYSLVALTVKNLPVI